MRTAAGCGVCVVLVAGVASAADAHSFARPEQVRVRHVDLDLTVDFDAKRLHGHATLTLDRRDPSKPLILDSRQLHIDRVETSADGTTFRPGQFASGKVHDVLGSPVTVPLPPNATAVRIHYATDPAASGL